jgi:hypothetical protein
MMKAKILLAIITACVLTGCKKTYTCSCFNPGGVFQTHEIKDTQKNAEQKCEEYSKSYQTVPWSETACTLD